MFIVKVLRIIPQFYVNMNLFKIKCFPAFRVSAECGMEETVESVDLQECGNNIPPIERSCFYPLILVIYFKIGFRV